MSATSTDTRGGGVGFAGLLTLLFIGLKLGHVIDWSWWWVLSPLWISFGVAIALMVLVLFAAVVVGSVKAARRR